MSLFRGLVEQRSFTPSSWGIGIPSNSAAIHTDSGESINDHTALQLIAVHACVRLLADSISGLPLDGYRKDGDLCVSLSPQPSLVAQPFQSMTTVEGVFQMVQAMAMRGEILCVIDGRNSLEYPTSILPVHPDFWTVNWNNADYNKPPIYRISGQVIPNEDILHIKRFSQPQHLHGLSPVTSARLGIGISLAAERYGARWFGDSANPSSVLQTDANLDDDQIKKVQKSWIESHGGKRLPAVLTGGFKWSPISITPEESQFLATRQFQRSEIAMLFGVPPHMIGDVSGSTSWGTGIEQQSIGFVTYTLRPWLTCIEAALSRLLPRGQYVKFNVDALLRGDTESRYAAYSQARAAGWLSVNDIRALEDRPPVENGDNYLQPLNMAPLGTTPPAVKEPSNDPAQ